MEAKTPITVEALINAPLEKVWTRWTDPAHVVHWNFASEDWHTPKVENDVRKDGKFAFTMAARDGSVSFDFGGTYTNVEPQKLLEYVLEDGRTVSVKFLPAGDGVKVIETFDPEQENPAEM